ncbi:MAG: RNA polymerase sigma factor [Bradymonadaceae bacterium]|nr:RNA polymerase sigma factor [Lujinxingiaceae bacterium]
MLLAIVKNFFGTKTAAAAVASVKPEDLCDEDLMIAYSKGDLAAFSVLVKRHERALFNYILRSCGRPDRAEELLQEVFMRVIKSADQYQKTAKFTTWVYTIARNLCIDTARKQNRRVEVSLDQPLGDGDDGEGRSMLDSLADLNVRSAGVDHERNEFRDRLADALAALPEEQREVFIMREVTGLKFQEIAEILGCPLPTVKSRMRYALEYLRGALAAYRDHSFDEEEKLEVAP